MICDYGLQKSFNSPFYFKLGFKLLINKEPIFNSYNFSSFWVAVSDKTSRWSPICAPCSLTNQNPCCNTLTNRNLFCTLSGYSSILLWVHTSTSSKIYNNSSTDLCTYIRNKVHLINIRKFYFKKKYNFSIHRLI